MTIISYNRAHFMIMTLSEAPVMLYNSCLFCLSWRSIDPLFIPVIRQAQRSLGTPLTGFVSICKHEFRGVPSLSRGPFMASCMKFKLKILQKLQDIFKKKNCSKGSLENVSNLKLEINSTVTSYHAFSIFNV